MTTRNIKTREGYDVWDKLCAIPKFGFLIGPSGGVVKVVDVGNWIDRDEAQKVVDDAQSELNLLRAELDRSRACLSRVDAENSALKAELAGVKSQQKPAASIRCTSPLGMTYSCDALTPNLPNGTLLYLSAGDATHVDARRWQYYAPKVAEMVNMSLDQMNKEIDEAIIDAAYAEQLSGGKQ